MTFEVKTDSGYRTIFTQSLVMLRETKDGVLLNLAQDVGLTWEIKVPYDEIRERIAWAEKEISVLKLPGPSS